MRGSARTRGDGPPGGMSIFTAFCGGYSTKWDHVRLRTGHWLQGGGLQNGKIAGLKLFVSPPSPDRVKLSVLPPLNEFLRTPLLSAWLELKGRRQNSSVASGDFLQRMINVGWQGFAAQFHPHHMLG